MTLDHIIKERYPTFIDALRDLDDALSMLFLFANLPSTTYVSPKTIALCQKLCHEFQHYLIVTHSLRKSFLSIKGIYYQATIQGQDILWLVPYRFVQRMSGDIDFRIMSTFIDFYTTLVGFVNYRLYTSIGLVYPPKFDQKSDERGGELGAFALEGKKVDSVSFQAELTDGANRYDKVTDDHRDEPSTSTTALTAQAEADRLALSIIHDPESDISSVPPLSATEAEVQSSEAIDTFEPLPASDADILPQPQFKGNEASTLFSDFTIFLSRETPRAPLEFLLKAFGCKRVGWDTVLGDGAFTNDEHDAKITHQIVDRPNLPPGAFPALTNGEGNDNENTEAEPESTARRTRECVAGRIYVQPQWVWDCINHGKLLRPDLYALGASLPPHLSPWVKPKRGAYDPTVPLEEQEKEGEAEIHAEEEDAEEGAEEKGDAKDVEMGIVKNANGIAENLFDRDDEVEAGEGMDVAGSEDESEEEEEEKAESGNDWEGISEEEDSELDDEEKERRSYQHELEAEALGLPVHDTKISNSSSDARRKAEKKMKERDEELDRLKMMMPNKKRKLFEKMEYGNKKREEEAAKLRQKRRRIEKASKSGVK
jgi:pescadillo protein